VLIWYDVHSAAGPSRKIILGFQGFLVIAHFSCMGSPIQPQKDEKYKIEKAGKYIFMLNYKLWILCVEFRSSPTLS
jgi:hypothetical protein